MKKKPPPTDSACQSPADHDLEKIREAVAARVAAEAVLVQAKAADKKWQPEKDDRFISACLEAQELGDGLLYASIHKGRFIFNASSGTWMRWNGTRWEDDIHEQALAAVENVAEVYRAFAGRCADRIKAATEADLPAGEIIKSAQKKLNAALRRVRRLHTDRGRCAALKFSRTNQQISLSADGEAFDNDPWLLACKNCVLDLRRGEPIDAQPEQMLSKGSPTPYMGYDYPAPTWEGFLDNVFEGCRETIAFLQRLLGYAITGDTTDHVLPVFWGAGRNGKGTIVEALKFVLGDLAGPIQAEMLLDQGRGRSSAAPSPDIMLLRGLRLGYASETDKGARFSPARVKWLTGADSLVGRWPHDRRPVTFKPTHKLILLTNNKPPAPPDDFAFWERVILIPFRLSYVNRELQADNERPADRHLFSKLRAEAAGILSWMVRGCMEWQRIGLAIPAKLREATIDYRAEEDFLQDWLDDRALVSPELVTRSGRLYEDFKIWWEENWKGKVPSPYTFSKVLQTRFVKDKDNTNCRIFLGIGLRNAAVA